MPLGSNAVYLALYPGSASHTRKEKWAWGRGYCLLALCVQVWSFDFAQFFRYCMIWLLTLCMRTWHIISDTVRFICFIQHPVFEHPVLHGLWCLLYICVLASRMVTCTWNNASIDNQAQFIDSLPQISPQTLPRHTKKAEAGFRSLRPLAPPHPSPYRKGSGNETNWDILQLHIFIHVGIICHTTTIDPFPLGMG